VTRTEQKYVIEAYRHIAPSFLAQSKDPWPSISSLLPSLWSRTDPTNDESTATQENPTVLDIGCGEGRYSSTVIQLGWLYIGVDTCSDFADHLCSRGIKAVVATQLALPFPPNTFEIVLSLNVLNHLSTAERRAEALKEIFRVLKPQGN
jgi:SAM-dependent methyltransferase